ncbi:GNAT family N-acetyltransferase [Cytobacillus dafuensis]|uniref:GNAT family N-acetyltransferase n=1 Tax=Cytobacillus dafuensis TaxID=1742359 RepID=A0A5B8Z009_CYTDA|nr:GNAT family N-acetyltransferase [Cytobacillus dafuensis]QED46178.1 GNAT family N-acetyltransferase [Cytobacillus dafuensis]
MEIYKATLHDLDGISKLFDQYRVFYNQPSNIHAAKDFIQERLKKEDSVILVAVENENYVGFTQLYPSFSSVSMKRLWILNDLFVDGGSRKLGVGGKLLGAAKQFAMDTQAKGLLLQTAVDNFTAQRLYEADGWEKDTNSFYYEFTF